jgi:hypothetical protein
VCAGLPYRYQYQQLTPQHGLKMDETSLHPTFEESLAVGLNLKICYLNIEGIVFIEKTHTTSDLNLLNRGKLLPATFMASQRTSEILKRTAFLHTQNARTTSMLLLLK